MATPESIPAPTDPSPAPRWLRVLADLGGFVLGGVLVVALWGKMVDPHAFAELAASEGLDFLLPAGWVAAIGLALEAVLGFALLFGLRHLKVLIPSAGLVAFFVFLTGRTYLSHLSGSHIDDGSCGCFGNIIDRSPTMAFWTDMGLLVPPLVVAFFARPPQPMSRERLRWGLTWGLSAAALVFAWFAPGLPLDDLATRLAPGVEAEALCAGQDENRVCMDDVIPEIVENRHVVLLARLDDEAFLERLDALNDYALEGVGPMLWVVTPASEEDVELFNLTHQPVFQLLPCPVGVVRPLYRTLPRTFVTQDGTVRRTIQDWPPLAEFAEESGSEDVDPDDGDGASADPQGDDPDDGG
ncbi:MAG: hypothetical protein P1V36_07625 [Planctomycetota bacterium]|nr:hypothetical protein [Planctomycetota bacterium]